MLPTVHKCHGKNRISASRRLSRQHVMLVGVLALFALQTHCLAQSNIESPPIEYSKTPDNNRVTDLTDKLKTGAATLEFDQKHGYLEALLKTLDIHVSSQTLVFSKTSMQLNYISPQNPRSIYFNDDVYVAWVQGSSIMEISTSDPKLGAAFYTLKMSPREPLIKRQLYNCLACHTSTLTQGVPGHTVRSVLPNLDGTIDAQRESFVTDHTSPIAQRWGGWYVTGKHGHMPHMGNAFVRRNRLQTNDNGNRSDLSESFYTRDWLSPHSDIVALMVLEHQTQMHNTFTRANFAVRQAQYDQANVYGPSRDDTSSIVPRDAKQESQLNIKHSAKKVVDYMLFVDEAPLTSEVGPSTEFVREFAARGPMDQNGRSLRAFNLKTRLFQYPCSYMIHSSAFDALEASLREQIYLQLWNVLSKKDQSDEYVHLNDEVRGSILSILRETKRQLPAYWTADKSKSR